MAIEDLYRTVIMEHYKNPLNKGLVEDESYKTVFLHNPSCGDQIKIQVKVIDDVVVDVRHDGKGCSICCSSASVMSDTIKGLKFEDAIKVIHDFYLLVQGKEVNDYNSLKEAIVYKGVSTFPARIKCATLPWKAAEKGLIGETDE